MTDATPLLELLDGFRRAKTLCAAVELGIFDGARPLGPGVAPLLEACAALGLLERRSGAYVNTSLADDYLRETAPRSLAPYVRYSSSVLYPLWTDLATTALCGPSRSAVSPLDSDARRRDFMLGMQRTGELSAAAVVSAFDLSRFRRVVDLGGATGYLALAARVVNPELQVVVFDRPAIIDLARAHVGEDAELIAGDFFCDALPPADLYLLGRILHNLTDAAATVLLRRVHVALAPGGAVLLAERLMSDDGESSISAHMQTLNMLVCTGGRERSAHEYETLLTRVGFGQVQVRSTGALLDAIRAER